MRVSDCGSRIERSERLSACGHAQAGRPNVIGLTGGIAAGKSTVGRMFKRLGAEVINADEIARSVLESPEICRKLRRHWGDAFFDRSGRPDRARIAQRAFSEPARLRELNAWVHPPTIKEMQRRVEGALQARAAPLIVIDAPLLMEAELGKWCDALMFVDADLPRRVARVEATRGWREEEIARREAVQAPLDEKRRRADAVVDNNGSEEKTFAQVKRLFTRWNRGFNDDNP